MKVICIDNSNPKMPHKFQPEDWIIEGEIYTVLGWYQDKVDGHNYYYQKEKTNEVKHNYRANRFLPLLEQDEQNNINKPMLSEKQMIQFTSTYELLLYLAQIKL